MIKKILLGVLALVVVLFLLAVGYAYYYGMIPRHVYETVPPEVPGFTKPAVLIFNKTNGFIHREGLPAANIMLEELAAKQGWEAFTTNNGAIHNAEDLQRFDLIVWNNVSGDVLTTEQRADLKAWIEQGGGWVGLHATGGDPEYDWAWYAEELLGAQFIGHTMDPHLQDADLYAEQGSEDLTGHLPTPWNVKQEEWYAFDQSPRGKGYEIVMTIDEDSYITQGKAMNGFIDNMEGEHPVVWRHNQGEGKVFYSSIGHTAETYSVPEYRELIRKAMVWAAD